MVKIKDRENHIVAVSSLGASVVLKVEEGAKTIWVSLTPQQARDISEIMNACAVLASLPERHP
jgi:hypothetical protein